MWNKFQCEQFGYSIHQKSLEDLFPPENDHVDIINQSKDWKIKPFWLSLTLNKGETYLHPIKVNGVVFSEEINLLRTSCIISLTCTRSGELYVKLKNPEIQFKKGYSKALLETISCKPREIIRKKFYFDSNNPNSEKQIILENFSLGSIHFDLKCTLEKPEERPLQLDPLSLKNDFALNFRNSNLRSIISQRDGPSVVNDPEYYYLNIFPLVLVTIFTCGICVLVIVVKSTTGGSSDEVQLQMIPELLEKETEKRVCGTDRGKFNDGT